MDRERKFWWRGRRVRAMPRVSGWDANVADAWARQADAAAGGRAARPTAIWFVLAVTAAAAQPHGSGAAATAPRSHTWSTMFGGYRAV